VSAAVIALTMALATLLAAPAWSEPSSDQASVVVVVGAPGEPEFETNFVKQASLWEKASALAGARSVVVGGSDGVKTNDFERLKQTLEAEPKEGRGDLWLVLIGHGTFDGKEARFNLQGPDLTADDLSSWLKPFRRPVAVINTASASAPFIGKTSGTNRVVIAATRSGNEQNFTRFGQYLSEAITDPQADLDQDGQISLLEAFLTASRRVAEFYKVEGRLATEHALLDDNGDGLGTPADWFRGLRATKKPRENARLDGLLAHQFHLIRSAAEQKLPPEQRARRDALERAVIVFRENKGKVPEEDYYRGLEKLLLDLARFYEADPAPSGSR